MMMVRLAFAAIVAAGGFQSHPVAADDAGTVEEIKALVLEMDQAYADEDMETIRRIRLPDQVSVTPRYGGAATLEAQVGTFGELEREHFDYSPMDVDLLDPEIALVTFEKSYNGTYKGETLPERVYVSEVWIRQGDAWRQRFYQETPIEKP